jgi:hypothetical protein
VLLAAGDQRPGRNLVFGPQVVQVPAQIVDQRRPLADEAFAVVDEQAYRPRAHISASSKAWWVAGIARSPIARPAAALTAAIVCDRLWVSAPITIISLSLRWD